MTASIMQPTYLPWSGYFNLIGRCDAFVFLDDVQFAKPSWQMRNRILFRNEAFILSVPTRGSRNQRLEDVQLAGDEFRAAHQRTLEHAYSKHPFGTSVLELLLPLIGDRSRQRLVDLNIAIIQAFAESLALAPRWLRASELHALGKRSSHLLGILEQLGETAYLSPEGSRGYITEEQVFQGTNVTVEYQAFDPRPYPQMGASEFISHLSVVDVVANLGWSEARKYVLATEGAANRLCEADGTVARKESSLHLTHISASVG
jgi:hypothetical protein